MLQAITLLKTRTPSANLRELLTAYAEELKQNHQVEEAQKILNLLVDWKNTFVRVVPLGQQEEQRFATE